MKEGFNLSLGIGGELFSSYFLQEGIKNTPNWERLNDSQVKEKYEAAKQAYLNFKKINNPNEADVEDYIIKPFLNILGFSFRRQQSLAGRTPDYVLFESEEKKNKFSSNKWDLALSLLEAKKWERPLDRRDPTDTEDPYIPSGQIMIYLSKAESDSGGRIAWGILTNGRVWRLYAQRWDKRGKYLEIDFESVFGRDLFEKSDLYKLYLFKIFLLFFSKEAFLEKAELGGKNFLDYSVEEGKIWEAELTENLKDRIYKEVIPSLAKGMYSSLPEGERDLRKIYEATLILLYRLLFILYAEDKGLLPPRDEKYDDYSLRKIREEIAKRMDKNDVFSKERTNYYSHLKNLFDIINKGDSSLGISPYNGGLFDSQSHSFLDTKIKISDHYLAIALDHLSRDYRFNPPKFINYKDLSVAHLGSIYEGLLEFKLEVAKTNLKIVKRGKREIYEEAKPGDTPDIPAGEIYLTNDKSERKATGSYYTPDYIVNYIVENTIGPLIQDKKEKIKEEKARLLEKIKNARGYNRKEYERRLTALDSKLIDEILSIRVLDPAMGSGHFLVGALNYLSTELYKVLGGEETKEAEKDYDVTWIKREVVERCLYGVDINPLAVELAKLSLWLETLSRGKPLNFLDHHLKVGNSLIGAELNEIIKFPVGKKKKQKIGSPSLPLEIENFQLDISKAVSSANLLMRISSDSIEGIKEKERLYKDSVELALAKIKRLANLWTAILFGLRKLNISGQQYLLNENLYRSIYNYVAKGAKENVQVDVAEKFLEEADKIATERKFFHWELEFPEVFFDEQGKILPNPGFDAVVGNPPYGAQINREEQDFLKEIFESSTTESSILFIEKGWKLTKNTLGMIVPKSLAFYESWESGRKYIYENSHIYRIGDVGIAFQDVIFEEIIIILGNDKRVLIIDEFEPLKKFSPVKRIKRTSEFSQKLKSILKNTFLIPTTALKENEQEILKKIFFKSDKIEALYKEIFGNINLTDIKKMLGKKEEEILTGPFFSMPEPQEDNQIPFIRRDPDLTRYLVKRWYLLKIPSDYKRIKRILKPRFFIKPLRGNRIISFYDLKGNFATHHHMISCTFKENIKYSYEFVVAVINAKITSFYIQNWLFGKTTETAREWNKPYFKRIPIPKIKFKLYDETQLLKLKKSYLSNDLEFLSEIKTFPSDSSILHDFISFLAEKITEYKHKKYFLELFLENKIQTEDKEMIEVLTELQTHKDWQENLSIDLKKEIARNLITLLQEKIYKTDYLIDQIVYYLYGLTQEEIKIVEEEIRA